MVLVALQDDLLDATFAEFQSAFPGQTIKKASATRPEPPGGPLTPSLLPQVGANLAKPGFMDAIIRETDDIDIQIVFCNAGYILTGFFHTRYRAP